MSETGLGWIGGIFIVVAIVLFAVAAYINWQGPAYGLALFGVACLAIGALTLIYRDQKK